MENFEKIYDFDDYSVVLSNHSIIFREYLPVDNWVDKPIHSHFDISIDKEEDGGKIEIKFKDRFGCEMVFIHYAPASLKSMFDFIRRGYNVDGGGFKEYGKKYFLLSSEEAEFYREEDWFEEECALADPELFEMGSWFIPFNRIKKSK